MVGSNDALRRRHENCTLKPPWLGCRVARVTYEWDPVKAAVNVRKHGVPFEEAASVFLDPVALTFLDPDHSQDEERAITIGRSVRHRVLFVAHTQRGEHLRIISARRATRREPDQYEEGIDEVAP